MLIEVLVGLLIALGVAFLLLNTYYRKPDYVNGLFDMSKETQQCMKMNSTSGFGTWVSSKPCSLQFFVYIEGLSRSTESLDCADSDYIPGCINTTQPTAFPCATATCDAEIGRFRKSYLRSILRTGSLATPSALEFFVQGSSASSDSRYVPAYIRLTTHRAADEPNKRYIEGVALPALPLQKWTLVTITKDGKRIDVFYNTQRVASKVLQFNPMSAGLSDDYSCGNEFIRGRIGYMNYHAKRLQQSDIDSIYQRVVDTRGSPIFDQFDFSIPPLPSFCMFGSCNPMPTVAPSDPFSVWNTSFA